MLRPLGDRVIVKQAPKEEMTKSGIILADMGDKQRPEQGEVIAIGPGRLLDSGSLAPMSLKVGDKIVFGGYPDKVKVDGVEYLVVSESDVTAVIE
ncbi:co-chaperone GroES [Patescibacteria group bacterium]|jgi:chaperonin GroES|nr:co-chaperone GroES [Patescibacteria group bacterium]